MKYSLGKYVTMKRKQAIHDYKEAVFRKEFEKAVKSSQHYGVPIKKMKRYRSAFTTEQVNYLEKEFKKYPYIGNSRRKDVSNVLDIPERAVKIWFQNRRMKEKKDVTNKDSDADERNAKTKCVNSQLINVSDIPSTNEPLLALPIITAMEEISNEANVDKNEAVNDTRSEAVISVPIRNQFYKEVTPCPNLVTLCNKSRSPNNSPTVITKHSSNSSKHNAEFSIDLYKKYKEESGNKNTKDGKIKLERDAAESAQERHNVRESKGHQKPEFIPILPASPIPQDLSSRKPNVQQYQQRLYTNGTPMPTQMIPGINVNNADMPLYLKGYYTQPYIPPGNTIWKPLNVAPIISTGIPRMSTNSTSMSTLQQQNMPPRNCTCDCHYGSPMVFQHSTPSPHVQYVLTAVPFQSSGHKFV